MRINEMITEGNALIFDKFSQAVFQEMYGGLCGEFVCWSLGLNGEGGGGNGGIRTSPVLNFKTHGLCRYISLNFELFISSWSFCKLLNPSEGLFWMFSEMVRGGEEANIGPLPIVLSNFWAKFWRLEQLFAVPATLSRLAFLRNFWAKFRFRAHIKHEKVKNCIENFSSCEFLECLSIFF